MVIKVDPKLLSGEAEVFRAMAREVTKAKGAVDGQQLPAATATAGVPFTSNLETIRQAILDLHAAASPALGLLGDDLAFFADAIGKGATLFVTTDTRLGGYVRAVATHE